MNTTTGAMAPVPPPPSPPNVDVTDQALVLATINVVVGFIILAFVIAACVGVWWREPITAAWRRANRGPPPI